MTLFESIQTFISADTALTSRLAGGIKPGVLPQNSSVPVLVVRVVSGPSQPPTHDSGASSWVSPRIEFTVWGQVYKTQEQIMLQLCALFRPFNGYLGGGSNGRFATTNVTLPRDITDPITRMVGIQVDIIGMLDMGTLS